MFAVRVAPVSNGPTDYPGSCNYAPNCRNGMIRMQRRWQLICGHWNRPQLND